MTFEEAVAKNNWTPEEQVQILLAYIERQNSNEAFSDYLQEAS